MLVVAEPSATAPTDSDRIVVRTAADSVAYLKGAQWTQRLPQLVQARLIQTFENAHLMRSVGRPQDGLTADYKLLLDIRRFEIDAQTGEAVVEVGVKLVGDRSGRIIAGQIFTSRVPGSAADGAVAANALDAALAPVLTQIVGWTRTRV